MRRDTSTPAGTGANETRMVRGDGMGGPSRHIVARSFLAGRRSTERRCACCDATPPTSALPAEPCPTCGAELPHDLPAADPVPVALTIPGAVDEILHRAEVDDANNRWWYRFGFEVGKAAGKAEAEDELAAVRLDRETVANLRPTGESCGRCGRPGYVRRSA